MDGLTVTVDIVSAEAKIFSGLCQRITATGSLGELGVEPRHAPLLTHLKPGLVRVVKQNGEEEVFYISGGMLEVQPFHVTVLADTVVRAAEIDEVKAEEARTKAERMLAQKGADFEYSTAAAELAQAAAQLSIARRFKKKRH